MEIDEFRKTYAKLKVKIDAMPTDRALESLELFLDIHRYQLPAFYTNHLVICEFGKGIINYKGRCYRKPSTIEITPHKVTGS